MTNFYNPPNKVLKLNFPAKRSTFQVFLLLVVTVCFLLQSYHYHNNQDEAYDECQICLHIQHQKLYSPVDSFVLPVRKQVFNASRLTIEAGTAVTVYSSRAPPA